jgi:hypothetical protein
VTQLTDLGGCQFSRNLSFKSRATCVPWARHDSLFTAAFEEQAAWLAAHATATMVAELMRSSWRAVTRMVTRVVGEARGKTDRLEGLRKIAIDEKAYRKGHRYITVVTDVDTGRVVWAAEGRSQATVEAFFAALGTERAATLTHVGCDGADWIHPVVKVKAPNAVLCLDSFYADLPVMPTWSAAAGGSPAGAPEVGIIVGLERRSNGIGADADLITHPRDIGFTTRPHQPGRPRRQGHSPDDPRPEQIADAAHGRARLPTIRRGDSPTGRPIMPTSEAPAES